MEPPTGRYYGVLAAGLSLGISGRVASDLGLRDTAIALFAVGLGIVLWQVGVALYGLSKED